MEPPFQESRIRLHLLKWGRGGQSVYKYILELCEAGLSVGHPYVWLRPNELERGSGGHDWGSQGRAPEWLYPSLTIGFLPWHSPLPTVPLIWRPLKDLYLTFLSLAVAQCPQLAGPR